MRINIEIPDSVIEEGRAIHIMAGMERIAYKLACEDNWRVKVSQCNACGKCCQECEYLEDGKCKLMTHRLGRPFLCCVSEPSFKRVPDCASLYKEV